MGRDGLHGWEHHALTHLLAVAVPLGMLLVAMGVTSLSALGNNLCGWPATLSCDQGLPAGVWGALAAFFWLCAGVSGWDCALFLIRPTADAAQRIGWWTAWGPAVLVVTVGTVVDRELSRGDLVLGAALLASAVLLVADTVAQRTAAPAHAARAVAIPVLAVALLAPVWAPPAFRWAERREARAQPGPHETFHLDDSHINPPDAPLP